MCQEGIPHTLTRISFEALFRVLAILLYLLGVSEHLFRRGSHQLCESDLLFRHWLLCECFETGEYFFYAPEHLGFKP